jgi:opacity protein-like surface antigen
MMIATRRVLLCGALFVTALFASAAAAQTGNQTDASVPVTAFGRQMERIDLGIGVMGSFTPNSSGTSLTPQKISQVPSNTAGVLFELRYVRSPLVGIQLNFNQARFTQNFTVTDTTGTPTGQLGYFLGIQAKENEYSMGYVAHGPEFFGIKSFAGAGIGAVEFHPTAGGGQDLPPEERVGFYFAVGAEYALFANFGFRAQYRQVFYGAPDFNQNYLATGARVSTVQPAVGFYLRF